MTSETATFERLREIVAYYADAEIEAVGPNFSIEDMWFGDVLDMIESAANAFDIGICEEGVMAIRTVSDLVRLIDSKLSEAKEEEGDHAVI